MIGGKIGLWFLSFSVIFLQACHAKILVSNEDYVKMPHLFQVDNYDRCMLYDEKAFYCTFEYVLEPLNKTNEVWTIIQNVSAEFWNFNHTILRHWICVTETCPNVKISDDSDPELVEALTNCYNEKFKEIDFRGTIANLTCNTWESKYPIDWLDIIFAIFCIAYILLVLYASFYEGLARYKPKEEYDSMLNTRTGRLIFTFSIPKNWIKLTTVNYTPEVEKFRAIQSMRLYNMFIVITCHTVMTFINLPVSNIQYNETMYQKLAALFMASGKLAMGTTFMISSLLLSYGLFETFKNKQLTLKDIGLATVNRFLRLTPTLLLVVLFHATWLRHLSGGPFWQLFAVNEYFRCRSNGWLNILYLNNDINTAQMCLQPTWFLAIDFQFFITIAILIWIIKKYELKLWTIWSSVLVVSIIATFCQNYYFNFRALDLPTAEINYGIRCTLGHLQWHYQLCSYIGNMSGPLMGLALGYIMSNYKNKKFVTTKFRQVLWWFVILGFSLGVIIGPGLVIMDGSYYHDRFWASVMVAISRPLFTFSMTTIVMGVVENYGWLVKYSLRFGPTYILGRLTYSAYLCHMSLVIIRAMNGRDMKYLSDFIMITTAFGDITLTFISATILTICWEIPMAELQKLVMPKKESESNKNITEKKE